MPKVQQRWSLAVLVAVALGLTAVAQGPPVATPTVLSRI